MITSLQSAPAVRIGDSERQQAAASLADHLAAGRLTLDEYDERVQGAYAARTAADLAPLFADLPSAGPQRRSGTRSPRLRSGRHHGPSPVIVLLALLLIVASLGLHLPLFPLVMVFWFRGAFRRHPGRRGSFV